MIIFSHVVLFLFLPSSSDQLWSSGIKDLMTLRGGKLHDSHIHSFILTLIQMYDDTDTDPHPLEPIWKSSYLEQSYFGTQLKVYLLSFAQAFNLQWFDLPLT